MHAGKPHLLDALPGKLITPQVVYKIAAPFVDRDSMTAIDHVRILRRIGKLQRIPYQTNRADRIPDPDKMQRTMAAECRFKSVRHLEGMRHSGGATGSLRKQADDVRDEPIIAGTQQSEHV